ncbi:hypothetical protein [Tomitella fengzijianii]|uniref:hypothetical protein n=1 Tax=Tomitella fengzijianii TaxID=2597660 RepID=UPI00131AF471|nr:hypothetical protein [Tomitella fengzijianii]
MTSRALPSEWEHLVADGDAARRADRSHSAGSGEDAGLRELWERAAGADPSELRRRADWCDARAADIDGLADSGRALPAGVLRALGSGAETPARGVEDALHVLGHHADALRNAAAALRAGAGAVDTVRARHVNALAAMAGLAVGAGRDASAPDDLQAAFSRSCSQTAASMRRIEHALSEALDEGRFAGGSRV